MTREIAQNPVYTAEPPIILEEKELYDLVAAVGNHELKAIILGSMVPNVAYTITPLWSHAMSLQGERPAWKFSKSLPHSYCRESFVSIGLVAKETVGANAYTAYKINERGRKIAIPLIGHLLDLSLSEEPSLYGISGPTSTNSEEGIRPCESRIKILDAVRTFEGERVRVADIATLIDFDTSKVGTVSDELATSGVLSKESSGRGKASVTFLPSSLLADITIREDVGSQLLFDVVDALQAHSREFPALPISNSDIAKKLIETGEYSYPESLLVREVSRKTQHLAHVRKALVPLRTVEEEKARQVVWATAAQYKVVERYLGIIDGIRQPDEDYLLEGADKARTIINDPDSVNYLVEKAKKDALGLKKMSDAKQKVHSQIKAIISKSDRPLSAREVQEILLDSGVKIHKNTVFRYMDALSELGSLATTNTPQGYKYFNIEDESS